ncbi:MAG: YncE family protein [Burkholderiales bacterium]
MSIRLLPLVFLVACLGAHAAPFAYVPVANGSVSVVDVASETVVATIPVPMGAHNGVAVNAAGTRAYVTNVESGNPSGSVSVIDTATNTVVATIAVGLTPYGVAVSPTGASVVVTNHFGSSVSIIDAAANAVVAEVPVDGQPWGVAAAPAGTGAYIANSLSSAVSLLDLGSHAIAASVPLGTTTRDVAVHPTLPRAYVTAFSNGIRVVDTTTNLETTAIPGTQDVVAVAVNRSGTRLYAVRNTDGTLLVIDTQSNAVVAAVPVGSVPTSVAVDPSETKVLVVNSANGVPGAGAVTFVDALTNAVTHTLAVPGASGAAGSFITPASMPGTGVVGINPYGPLTATGATVHANTISDLQPGAVIQLGSAAGTPGSYVEIDFRGFDLAAGSTLTIRSGAAMQSVVLSNLNSAPSAIRGTLQAQGGNGAAPPAMALVNGGGVTVLTGGTISGPGGLEVSGLAGSWYAGGPVVNQGVIDGGPALGIAGLAINGGGQFRGDATLLSTLTHANNPVNGAHYLSNGLQVYPGTGSDVGLILHAYGSAPQYLNVTVHGNATLAMPSAWPPGPARPANNAVVPPGGSRAAGSPEPAYGGGSMIVQATGGLRLAGGSTNDFVFPGGVVLRAAGVLDLNGVTVNQGWTTTGKPFQGIYFESPSITSTAPVEVYSNDLNWTNFSTLPVGHFHVSRLVRRPDASAGYAPADLDAPHQNTYSTLIEAAANGQCWVCLVNFAPIQVQ